MKILLDIRNIGQSGARFYALNLIDHLSRLDVKSEFFVLKDKSTPNDILPTSNNFKIITGPAKPLFLWLIWNNTRLPQIIDKNGIDIYHSVKHVTSFKNKCANVITFHSARLFFFPEHYRPMEYFYWKFFQPICSNRYDAIITVSNAERNNYINFLPAAEEKYHTTHLAHNEKFCLISDSQLKEKVRKKYDLPKKFILTVGRIHPIKNFETCIKTFCLIRNNYHLPHKFVIVGDNFHYKERIDELVHEHRLTNDVIFTGFVNNDLPVLYNLADLFLFLPLYDAFPQVCLEAMACGLPIVCSNTGGLNEMMSDAARYHSPHDYHGVAKSIVELLSTPGLRRTFQDKNLLRAASFSWENTAAKTMEIYSDLLSTKPDRRYTTRL